MAYVATFAYNVVVDLVGLIYSHNVREYVEPHRQDGLQTL
jgi:hypothetical protein